MAAPRHVLLELDDDDDRSIASASSAALGIESSATSFSPAARDLARPTPPPRLRACRRRRPRRFRRRGRPIGRRRRSVAAGPGTPPQRRPTTVADEDGARTTSSRFWGVSWHRQRKKWQALLYRRERQDALPRPLRRRGGGARANQAIRDAGLQGQRRMNAVDATGALVPGPAQRATAPPSSRRDRRARRRRRRPPSSGA